MEHINKDICIKQGVNSLQEKHRLDKRVSKNESKLKLEDES